MSIVLQNYVQVSQGARVKPMAPLMPGGIEVMRDGGFAVQLSWMQMLIIVDHARSCWRSSPGWSPERRSAAPCGPASRICKMAGLLGIDTDRTISLTFVIGAALAAVAGLMFLLYYGVIDFYIGFIAGREGLHRGGAGRHRVAARARCWAGC